MPPKKRKIDDDSDDDSDPSIEDCALVSSKPDVVISLLQPDVKIVDPFQNSLFIQPNVMTMTVPALKATGVMKSSLLHLLRRIEF